MTTPATDPLSPAERSARMALIRGRDTQPELRVRRFLHATGLRYRLHQRVLNTRPDLVFTQRRTVVFVHGCIWHRHPDPACPLTRTPKSRITFWTTKFAENVARDARQRATLEAAGWRVLVIWECQTTQPAALENLTRTLNAAKSAHGATASLTQFPPGRRSGRHVRVIVSRKTVRALP